MNNLQKVIVYAYEKGYRVTEQGKLVSPFGRELLIKKRGKQRYPTFSVNVGDMTVSGVYGIPVHKFASYCFYKEESFKEGIVTRHMNANTEDVSLKNIKLGSYSDNEYDKSKEVRTRSATLARRSQGYKAYNRRFNDEQIIAIRNDGGSYAEIARKYGVTPECIGNIVKGRTYKDVGSKGSN